MIVAIQVVRLQYYEFFSKFFVETGVAFAPFRFRKESSADTVDIKGIK
jgi:V/A-type H+-transporting ATPase subunit I